MENRPDKYTKPLAKKPEEKSDKKEIKPVVQSSSKLKKQSFGEKFFSTFIVSDAKTVGNYVANEVVKPKIKEILANSIEGAVNMFLFEGGVKPSKRATNSGSNFIYTTPYNNMYKGAQQAKQVATNAAERMKRPGYQIIYETKAEAQEVRANIVDLIKDYKRASIHDLYTLSNIDTDRNHTLDSWGWGLNELEAVAHADIMMIRDNGEVQYMLDMPKPVQIM